MSERRMLIAALKNYCDMIWEYDRESGKIFLHYDITAQKYEGKAYTVPELTGIFRDEFGIGISDSLWKKYLNEDYLKSLFNGKGDSELELQFLLPVSQLRWYRIRIVKTDEKTLIISGRDMYGEFKERSIYHSVRESFDNIMSISLETHTCVVIYIRSEDGEIEPDLQYEEVLERLADKYVAEGEREKVKAELRLDAVIKRLRAAPEYVIYINTLTDNIKGCKKITFSYADKAHKFITLTTLNIGEIVTRYEKLLTDTKEENYKDSLTGAYNRNYYETNLKQSVFSGGLAVLDIDNFKYCNDTMGHAAGDMLLSGVAAEIKGELSEGDMLVRFGGDEFLLMLPSASSEKLENTLERIRGRVNKNGGDICEGLFVTLSIGGVISKNETVQEAAYRADRLMYRAKTKKNFVVTEHSFDIPHGAELAASEQQVLIVDDSAINREMLSKMIEGEFGVIEAENGKECMKKLKEYGTGIALVLLDIIMPEMDGIEVLSEMNRLHYTDDIPVIMISADGSDTNIRRAFDMGVTDYISRPYDSKVVMRRINNTIRLYSKQHRLAALTDRQQMENIRSSRAMIDVLSGILGRKNGESAPHIWRIRKVTEMLLERLILKTDKYGLSWQDCEMIAEAAVLHDVGKIEIDGAILNKPGRLTSDERRIIEGHTVIGEEILLDGAGDSIEDIPMLYTAAQICRWHHERFDGNGYPDRLKGDDIPIAAQVVSIADVYDALVSRRAYKKPYPSEKAISMIVSGDCGIFNPLLVECLCEIIGKLNEDIYADGKHTEEEL